MARRPASLHDFIGQPRVVSQLRELVAGAKARGEAVPALLFIGRPGTGKSLLARAVAREYEGPSAPETPSVLKRVIGGPRMTREMVELLVTLQHGDILFIDETHALDREGQELLYIAIDERRTFARNSKGKLDRTKSESIAEFTTVCATTEPGKLQRALRSRLLPIILDRYSIVELKVIAEKIAASVDLHITPQGARCLAERSQRTPRNVTRLIELLAVTMPKGDTVTQETVRNFMVKQGIDELGLDPTQRQMLEVLASARRTKSLEVVASKLGVDRLYVRTEVEPLLLDLELVEIGNRGRSLTAKGRAVVDNMAAPADESGDATALEVN